VLVRVVLRVVSSCRPFSALPGTTSHATPDDKGRDLESGLPHGRLHQRQRQSTAEHQRPRSLDRGRAPTYASSLWHPSEPQQPPTPSTRIPVRHLARDPAGLVQPWVAVAAAPRSSYARLRHLVMLSPPGCPLPRSNLALSPGPALQRTGESSPPAQLIVLDLGRLSVALGRRGLSPKYPSATLVPNSPALDPRGGEELLPIVPGTNWNLPGRHKGVPLRDGTLGMPRWPGSPGHAAPAGLAAPGLLRRAWTLRATRWSGRIPRARPIHNRVTLRSRESLAMESVVPKLCGPGRRSRQ